MRKLFHVNIVSAIIIHVGIVFAAFFQISSEYERAGEVKN